MKAKDYADIFNAKVRDGQDPAESAAQLAMAFVKEVGDIGKQRQCRTNASFRAVCNEQDAKWRAFCRLVPVINPKTFEIALYSVMPQAYHAWKGTGAPSPISQTEGVGQQ